MAELCADDEVLTTRYLAIGESQSLVAMVWAAWAFGLAIANQLLSQELARRASLPTDWPQCPKCHCRLRSKGMRPRQIQTLVGLVQFSRRVGRCRNDCKGVMVAPLDQELELDSDQQTSQEVVKLGCLLAVFVPFDTATVLQITDWGELKCNNSLELGAVVGHEGNGTARTGASFTKLRN